MGEIATPRCDRLNNYIHEEPFRAPLQGNEWELLARSLERELAVARGKLEEIVNVFFDGSNIPKEPTELERILLTCDDTLARLDSMAKEGK